MIQPNWCQINKQTLNTIKVQCISVCNYSRNCVLSPTRSSRVSHLRGRASACSSTNEPNLLVPALHSGTPSNPACPRQASPPSSSSFKDERDLQLAPGDGSRQVPFPKHDGPKLPRTSIQRLESRTACVRLPRPGGMLRRKMEHVTGGQMKCKQGMYLNITRVRAFRELTA